MQCPACNYVLGAFDAKCPRCGKAPSEVNAAPPAPIPSAPPPTPAPFLPNQMGGQPHPGHYPPPPLEGDTTGGVIPYKNPCALIAYYLGVATLIPCLGMITGIAAFILGIIGLKYAKENPIVKGTVHAWIGIVAGFLIGGGQWFVLLLIILGGRK